VDLSASLLRVARGVTDAPLIRADLRQLPVRPASMDLTVNLFTSFGYFELDAEHAAAAAEMVATVRPGGWFVIDLLNPAAVRSRLVSREKVGEGGTSALVSRTLSPDGRYVGKAIEWADGRRFVERVRLFEPVEIAEMLEHAGLTITHRFGDYDGHTLAPDSSRTILIGRAA
jgi:SAM-dependent methyltransferase